MPCWSRCQTTRALVSVRAAATCAKYGRRRNRMSVRLQRGQQQQRHGRQQSDPRRPLHCQPLDLKLGDYPSVDTHSEQMQSSVAGNSSVHPVFTFVQTDVREPAKLLTPCYLLVVIMDPGQPHLTLISDLVLSRVLSTLAAVASGCISNLCRFSNCRSGNVSAHSLHLQQN